ncbi:MAG: 1-acyl-sn-glycerol-3-phosphate acyltransferase [Vicinamibacterales bacterium]
MIAAPSGAARAPGTGETWRTWRMTRVIAPAASLCSRYFRTRVVGLEHVPVARPVIFVGKHPRSYLYLETLVMGFHTFWKTERPPFRVLEFRGTSLHRMPGIGWLRRHVGSVPASAAAARRVLAGGESVLIFPGGTRELYGPADELRWQGRDGFARLAIRTGTPVVPFAIAGADRQHPWRLPLGSVSLWLPPVPLPVRLEIRFGRPLDPPSPADGLPATARAEAASRFASDVETATRALLRTPGEPAATRTRGSTTTRAATPGSTTTRVATPGSTTTRAAAAPAEPTTPSAAPAPAAPVLDPTRWRYRFGYLRVGAWLSRYHRVRLQGTPPDGPCIYVAHHGAGYLNLDLAVAVYQLAWRDLFERGGTARPLRVAAAQGHGIERALPGLAWVKRHAGLIDPSEASCLAALARGEQLLLTPGGRREASPDARDYALRWDQRYGFVRLAMKTGVPVVPLAVVGGYAAYPGRTVGRLSFWSPVPLPARIDIAIGTPIAVPHTPDRARDTAALAPWHQQIRAATQALYDRLVAARDRRTVA